MPRTARLAMKKWFCAALHRFGRRYIYPTESLFGTWGLYCEYGVNANGPFHRECSLYDSWITLQPANRGYRDERGEIEPLRWHRIGCRRIAVDDAGWQPFRKIVRLTRDELWLRTELGHEATTGASNATDGEPRRPTPKRFTNNTAANERPKQAAHTLHRTK